MMSSCRAACVGLFLLCSAVASPAARAKVVISLDFSLELAGGLFDPRAPGGAQAQAAMQRAAQAFSDRIVDDLTAISPGGLNVWTPRIINPATGLPMTPNLPGVQAGVIKVYVASRTLEGATESAEAVAGSATALGSAAFVGNANSRGQAGALASPRTDHGPWGGSVAFDDGTPWHFGLTTVGLTTGEVDFLSVATHELAHLLGFSIDQPSYGRLVTSGGKFIGAKATAANGGANPSAVGSHWVGMSSRAGVGGPAQVALMDAAIPLGTRRRMTLLDWAALDDVGWGVALPGDANADGAVDFSDFQILERGFGRPDARWATGDFTEDGQVTAADLRQLLLHYGRRIDGAAAPVPADEAAALAAFAASVPEPAGVGVVAALLCVVMRRPRR
jgi:hypothetical protein